MRTNHAGDHGDLAGMPDGVLYDSFEHNFVGIVAAGKLLGQIFGREITDALFEEIATLVPAGDEFVPGDWRLGQVFFGIPTGQGMGLGGNAHPFVPEEQMLQERGNRMRTGDGWCNGELWRDFRHQVGEGRPVPGVF